MVHFIGAGPGAADLITLRGAKLLGGADAVIYAGSLVSEDLLGYCKPECEIYNSATMTLDEVIAVMLRVSANGGDVARLHTGDPSLYGAIREQLDRLTELGIAFDITPGVSAFSAAAASLGVEYTLPGVSQTVTISRVAGRTEVPEGVTTIFYLSAGLTAKAQSELLEKYAPDTPAAIVYKASWAEERVYRCTVSTIDETARRGGIGNHALIIAGDVLGGDYELSKLYDPTFATAFREASS